jgi:hypothetical protein
VVFEVVAIDLALETQEELDRHRTDQAAKITERLDDSFHPNLVHELNDLAGKLKGLPSQLYVQAICTLELLYHVLNKAKLYYVQRCPVELGEFHWFVDAKEASVTPYEELWRTVVMPLLESKSLKRPMFAIKGADYSYFDKFCGELPEPPEHLKEGFERVPTGPFRYFDIRKVFEQNLRFEQSHENPGIQLVDILTTSVRRGMNGNLQESGWARSASSWSQSILGANTIHLIRLSPGPVRAGARPPYWEVVRLTDRLRKQMVLEGYTVEGADEG